MAELVVLDVGHGSSAVLISGSTTVVVDAGIGDSLLSFLEERGITTVDVLLISHADADHVASAATLLLQSDLIVKKVRANPDARRDSKSWELFRRAVRDARERSSVDVRAELTTGTTQDIHVPDLSVEILHPPPEEALGGVGGQWLNGSEITANGLSAVVRVSSQTRSALLCADLDGPGLDVLINSGSNLTANLLVFPHHGGRPGPTNIDDFTSRICSAVGADCVVFSNGRGRYDLPRPEVVQAVRRALPEAHIACTQLSALCSAVLPADDLVHLGTLTAAGRSGRKCCAGTIIMDFDGADREYIPSTAAHRDFVHSYALSGLCRAD